MFLNIILCTFVFLMKKHQFHYTQCLIFVVMPEVWLSFSSIARYIIEKKET